MTIETKRSRLYLYIDRQASDAFKKVLIDHGINPAYVALVVSRVSPNIDRSGIYQAHPEMMAKDSGLEPRQVYDAIPALSEAGIEYDPEHYVWLVKDHVDQYLDFGGNNPKIIPHVIEYLNRLPKCELTNRVLREWRQREALLPDKGGKKVKRNVKVNGNVKGGYPITDPITDPIADNRVTSMPKLGGAS